MAKFIKSTKSAFSSWGNFKEASQRAVGRLEQFNNITSPSPYYRTGGGVTDRKEQIMTWRLPNRNTVRMYINPESFSIKEAKVINSIRTKGGYVVQYWGEQFPVITMSGTTGSSGIEGINILRDVYLSENRAFDLVANALSRKAGSSTSVDDLINGVVNSTIDTDSVFRPSLASLALNVGLYYQGVFYRGFFNSLDVTETVDKLGLFSYTIGFTVTHISGKRKNYLAWHKTPIADDAGSSLLNGIGNSIRSWVGLSEQQPQQFHPENAPNTFGGNQLAASLGFDGNSAVGESRDNIKIFK